MLSVVCACSYDDMAEKFIPKEESEFAKAYIEKLRAGDFEYVKSLMSQEILPKINDETLSEIVGYFRDGEPKSIKVIGSQVNVFNDQWQGNFTFEYEFESGWNLANAVLRKVGDGYEVIGLNVYQTDASLKEINAFTLSGKTFFHYAVLIAAIVIPVFVLVTVYFCAKTPMPRRKWLWVLFILFGVGAIQINWASGQFALQLLSIHLFGASAVSAGPYAPWIISASVPLGAILFWLKRKKLLSSHANSKSYVDAGPA